jgi:hypothetical protein
MFRKISRIDVFQFALSTALTFGASSAWATGIVENFESYPVGTFPVPAWQDVGTVDPTPPISGTGDPMRAGVRSRDETAGLDGAGRGSIPAKSNCAMVILAASQYMRPPV